MINGKGDEGLSARAGYYRKSGVPRCGSSYADGSQRTEKLPEQRSTEQGREFPQDIIDKGNGTHFRVACLRDEDTRQGIVTESGTDGQPVGKATPLQQAGCRYGSGPCPDYRQNR